MINFLSLRGSHRLSRKSAASVLLFVQATPDKKQQLLIRIVDMRQMLANNFTLNSHSGVRIKIFKLFLDPSWRRVLIEGVDGIVIQTRKNQDCLRLVKYRTARYFYNFASSVREGVSCLTGQIPKKEPFFGLFVVSGIWKFRSWKPWEERPKSKVPFVVRFY